MSKESENQSANLPQKPAQSLSLLQSSGFETSNGMARLMQELARDFTTGLLSKEQANVMLNAAGKVITTASLNVRTGRIKPKSDPIASIFEADDVAKPK